MSSGSWLTSAESKNRWYHHGGCHPPGPLILPLGCPSSWVVRWTSRRLEFLPQARSGRTPGRCWTRLFCPPGPLPSSCCLSRWAVAPRLDNQSPAYVWPSSQRLAQYSQFVVVVDTSAPLLPPPSCLCCSEWVIDVWCIYCIYAPLVKLVAQRLVTRMKKPQGSFCCHWVSLICTLCLVDCCVLFWQQRRWIDS